MIGGVGVGERSGHVQGAVRVVKGYSQLILLFHGHFHCVLFG